MPRTSVAIAASLLVAACDGAGDVEPVAVDAVPRAGPPGTGGLDLEVDGALVRGNTLTFTVTGLRRGQKVHLAAGTGREPGAYCPPLFQGLCADVRSPVVLGSAYADATGTARLTRTVPALPSDRWFFQALTAVPFAATSDVVGRYRLRHGTFLPVTFQRLHLSGGTLTGDILEAGAWSDRANYLDHPWACYVTTPLHLAPSPAGATCPGCEYTWEIALPDPFVEQEIEGECTSYFGHDAAWFDALFVPHVVGTRDVDGGLGRLAGGAEWGLDLDYQDPTYGTIYPVSMIYEPVLQSWWTLGPISRIVHPTYDEIVLGVGYRGGFYY